MNWQPTCDFKCVIRHFSKPYTDTWNIRINEAGEVETHCKWSEKVLVQKWIDADSPIRVVVDGKFVPEFEWRDIPVEKEA